jgi:hypothetical protein
MTKQSEAEKELDIDKARKKTRKFPCQASDLDERIKRFDKKTIEYVCVIFVSIFTTLTILTIYLTHK